MSYRYGRKKRAETCPIAPKPLRPTWQVATERGRSVKASSTRGMRRAAIRKATELRVKAETSIVRRKGLEGKHLSDTRRATLFKDLPSPYAIAYKKHPELFKGVYYDLR